jgi:hypothetical protein
MADLTFAIFKVLMSDADYCEGLYQFYMKYDNTIIDVISPRTFAIFGYKSGGFELYTYNMPKLLKIQLDNLIDQRTVYKASVNEAINLVVAEYKGISLIKGTAPE